MVNIRPLESNIVKDGSQPWISGSVYHFISNLGSIVELVAKAYAILFERGCRLHMETACEIHPILQRPANLVPRRSISVLAWPKHKQMLPFGLAELSYRDMLRENHLYGAIAIRMAGKYDTQCWIAVFIRHNQSQSTAVLHRGNNLRVGSNCNAENSQQAKKPRCSHVFCLLREGIDQQHHIYLRKDTGGGDYLKAPFRAVNFHP